MYFCVTKYWFFSWYAWPVCECSGKFMPDWSATAVQSWPADGKIWHCDVRSYNYTIYTNSAFFHYTITFLFFPLLDLSH